MSRSDLGDVTLEDVELTDQDEKEFALAAASAGRKGYEEALAAGLTVTVAVGDELYRVEPSGARRKVGNLTPGLWIKPGTKMRI